MDIGYGPLLLNCVISQSGLTERLFFLRLMIQFFAAFVEKIFNLIQEEFETNPKSDEW